MVAEELPTRMPIHVPTQIDPVPAIVASIFLIGSVVMLSPLALETKGHLQIRYKYN